MVRSPIYSRIDHTNLQLSRPILVFLEGLEDKAIK